MILYISEGRHGHTDALVRACAKMYSEATGVCVSDDLRIDRTEHGKPFFVDDENICFSVSHSGDMWVCLMASHTVGIDIQEVRKIRSEDIAQRYFSEQERHYVDLWGDEGFYDLWVRKEALVKYFGLTMAQGISGFEVAERGELPCRLNIADEEVFMQHVDMGPFVKCAYASKTPGEVRMEWM